MSTSMIDFHTLYERYAPDVKRFAIYLSGDFALAEDITSETFVRAWTAPDAIRVETVKAYLFTIARNLYLKELRRGGRHSRLDDGIPDLAPNPEISAERREELGRVLDGLQLLPEVARAALLMRVQNDLPYGEIAAALGLSLTAVKVKIHRARIKLAQLR